jgi:G2/mitotic-specific cyclin 3/4
MLGGGGIKAAAKRTAFGDVSNTVNGVRPSKDDSAIPTKPGLQVAGKPLQAVQEKKSAVFLRPAQRPLSVSSLKGLLTGVTGVAASDSTGRQIGAEAGLVGSSANSRKVLTKRTTTVFKDPSLNTVQEVAVDPPCQHMTLSSTAATSQPLSRPIPNLQPPAKGVATSEDPVKELRNPTSEIIQIEVNEALVETTTLSTKTETELAVSSDAIYIDEKGVLQVYEEGVAKIQEAERPVAVNPTKQIKPALEKSETREMSGPKALAPLHTQQPIFPRHPQPATSEPEEYWDEDDEDNYDEEGYVTARSYRSKGENTTGGATTVLFPHANQKVKREIAAAKEIVEATRTAEEIEDECYDTSMVAEYGDEIFDYMKQLEVCFFFTSLRFTLLMTHDRSKCYRMLTTWTTNTRSSGLCAPC